VIVRAPEKKKPGRKANSNSAHGIQKIMPAAFMMIRMANSMAWRAPRSHWRHDRAGIVTNALQCQFLLINVCTI
jgi:hypothetical protein